MHPSRSGLPDYRGRVRLRRRISQVFWRFSRWTPVTEEIPERGVLLGVPHTSNWDLLFMLMISWRIGKPFHFLAKKSLFRRPMGAVMRALGGIPVDRSAEQGLVREIVAKAERGEQFLLVVTPEATRGRVEYWKSGFYRIARAAELPVVMGFVDSRRKECGLGPHFTLTGNVRADMDRIRANYAGMIGVRPDMSGEPRLREEPEA